MIQFHQMFLVILFFFGVLKVIYMQSWYSSIRESQIGNNLFNVIVTVDAVECGVWCSQLAECKSYQTEKV